MVIQKACLKRLSLKTAKPSLPLMNITLKATSSAPSTITKLSKKMSMIKTEQSSKQSLTTLTNHPQNSMRKRNWTKKAKLKPKSTLSAKKPILSTINQAQALSPLKPTKMALKQPSAMTTMTA